LFPLCHTCARENKFNVFCKKHPPGVPSRQFVTEKKRIER